MPLIINRIKYYRWRFGKVGYTVQGQGKPLLLIHGTGYGQSLRVFRKVKPELAKHYRVYAIDLLGFGCSETPPLSYSAYLYASLIRDFITDIIGYETMVITQSAAYAVKAYGLAAEYISKLILIERAPSKPMNRRLYKIISLIGWKMEWPIGKFFIRCILGAGWSNMLNADITQDLERIDIPILIIKGNKLNVARCLRFLRGEQPST
jgi:pimeloyl-ACP methyl ester carboxylesterase